ncbi:dual specificity protein kinase yak1 [Sorochytrium milnesiophthora]
MDDDARPARGSNYSLNADIDIEADFDGSATTPRRRASRIPRPAILAATATPATQSSTPDAALSASVAHTVTDPAADAIDRRMPLSGTPRSQTTSTAAHVNVQMDSPQRSSLRKSTQSIDVINNNNNNSNTGASPYHHRRRRSSSAPDHLNDYATAESTDAPANAISPPQKSPFTTPSSGYSTPIGQLDTEGASNATPRAKSVKSSAAATANGTADSLGRRSLAVSPLALPGKPGQGQQLRLAATHSTRSPTSAAYAAIPSYQPPLPQQQQPSNANGGSQHHRYPSGTMSASSTPTSSNPIAHPKSPYYSSSSSSTSALKSPPVPSSLPTSSSTLASSSQPPSKLPTPAATGLGIQPQSSLSSSSSTPRSSTAGTRPTSAAATTSSSAQSGTAAAAAPSNPRTSSSSTATPSQTSSSASTNSSAAALPAAAPYVLQFKGTHIDYHKKHLRLSTPNLWHIQPPQLQLLVSNHKRKKSTGVNAFGDPISGIPVPSNQHRRKRSTDLKGSVRASSTPAGAAAAAPMLNGKSPAKAATPSSHSKMSAFSVGLGVGLNGLPKRLIRQPHDNPLVKQTVYLLETYSRCNPQFRYDGKRQNPRRVLTKPSKGVKNDGHDNEDNDYILYVNDILGDDEGKRYLIIDILGQGTFGQVVKCRNLKTRDIVAVKVVKNKPAYFNQSMMEVTILELLNKRHDPSNRHHITRMHDTFIFRKHLCLVFELLSINLYELIKQNQFRGLSTNLVKIFTQQILDVLCILNEAKIIHCDLKPENILLKDLQDTTIKVIDFGSACHEQQTVYTYIQSRFYRSPEVLLGLPYSSSIDMWSLGCIVAELFLGLPLFPGTSEYNQISRIVEMLGQPPAYMIEVGKSAVHFFDKKPPPPGSSQGKASFSLKPREQYMKERGCTEQPSKRYFNGTHLHEIIMQYPLNRKLSKAEVDAEMQNRRSLADFVSGLLSLNPIERWSPHQAKQHPFITGQPFTAPYVPSHKAAKISTAAASTALLPPTSSTSTNAAAAIANSAASNERVSGGLVLPMTERSKEQSSSSSLGVASERTPTQSRRPRANTFTAPVKSMSTTAIKSSSSTSSTRGAGGSSNSKSSNAPLSKDALDAALSKLVDSAQVPISTASPSDNDKAPNAPQMSRKQSFASANMSSSAGRPLGANAATPSNNASAYYSPRESSASSSSAINTDAMLANLTAALSTSTEGRRSRESPSEGLMSPAINQSLREAENARIRKTSIADLTASAYNRQLAAAAAAAAQQSAASASSAIELVDASGVPSSPSHARRRSDKHSLVQPIIGSASAFSTQPPSPFAVGTPVRSGYLSYPHSPAQLEFTVSSSQPMLSPRTNMPLATTIDIGTPPHSSSQLGFPADVTASSAAPASTPATGPGTLTATNSPSLRTAVPRASDSSANNSYFPPMTAGPTQDSFQFPSPSMGSYLPMRKARSQSISIPGLFGTLNYTSHLSSLYGQQNQQHYGMGHQYAGFAGGWGAVAAAGGGAGGHYGAGNGTGGLGSMSGLSAGGPNDVFDQHRFEDHPAWKLTNRSVPEDWDVYNDEDLGIDLEELEFDDEDELVLKDVEEGFGPTYHHTGSRRPSTKDEGDVRRSVGSSAAGSNSSLSLQQQQQQQQQQQVRRRSSISMESLASLLHSPQTPRMSSTELPVTNPVTDGDKRLHERRASRVRQLSARSLPSSPQMGVKSPATAPASSATTNGLPGHFPSTSMSSEYLASINDQFDASYGRPIDVYGSSAHASPNGNSGGDGVGTSSEDGLPLHYNRRASLNLPRQSPYVGQQQPPYVPHIASINVPDASAFPPMSANSSSSMANALLSPSIPLSSSWNAAAGRYFPTNQSPLRQSLGNVPPPTHDALLAAFGTANPRAMYSPSASSSQFDPTGLEAVPSTFSSPVSDQDHAAALRRKSLILGQQYLQQQQQMQMQMQMQQQQQQQQQQQAPSALFSSMPNLYTAATYTSYPPSAAASIANTPTSTRTGDPAMHMGMSPLMTSSAVPIASGSNSNKPSPVLDTIQEQHQHSPDRSNARFSYASSSHTADQTPGAWRSSKDSLDSPSDDQQQQQQRRQRPNVSSMTSALSSTSSSSAANSSGWSSRQ